jgi:hypothetical protein
MPTQQYSLEASAQRPIELFQKKKKLTWQRPLEEEGGGFISISITDGVLYVCADSRFQQQHKKGPIAIEEEFFSFSRL